MLPFVFFDESKMFGAHAWGLMCALGYFAWDYVATRRVKQLGYDARTFGSFTAWTFLSCAFFAHALDSVFYHWDDLVRRPHSIFFVWENSSSMGGIIGAIVGAIGWRFITFRKQNRFSMGLRKARLPILPYADMMSATFPVAMTFGRLGCAVIHDHPGVLAPVGTWIAHRWPTSGDEGVTRHFGPVSVQFGGSETRYDLGTVEFFYVAVIAIAFALTFSRNLRVGTYTAIACMVYPPARFVMDFYRLTDAQGGDVRHGSLTFAQYANIAMFALGVYIAVRLVRDAAFGRDTSLLVVGANDIAVKSVPAVLQRGD